MLRVLCVTCQLVACHSTNRSYLITSQPEHVRTCQHGSTGHACAALSIAARQLLQPAWLGSTTQHLQKCAQLHLKYVDHPHNSKLPQNIYRYTYRPVHVMPCTEQCSKQHTTEAEHNTQHNPGTPAAPTLLPSRPKPAMPPTTTAQHQQPQQQLPPGLRSTLTTPSPHPHHTLTSTNPPTPAPTPAHTSQQAHLNHHSKHSKHSKHTTTRTQASQPLTH